MNKENKNSLVALIPIVVLIALLAADILLFGADSILGASQVALLTSGGVCIGLSMWLYKTPWATFEKALVEHVGNVATAILILFLIGAISGTWMTSGVVPSFIYYGLKIISPKIFLLTTCVLCALVSLMTGSSWTTIATVGVALLGIGRAEGFPDAMTAGAIISGAYFGDKISPLSDTTVLASSINRVDIFKHIRYMMLTTIPSFVITILIFTVLGFSHGGDESGLMDVYASVLKGKFNLTPWLMIVPVITGIMIWRKWPALIVLAISSVAAAVAAIVFQPEIVRGIGYGVTEGSPFRVFFAGTVKSIYDSVSIQSGNPQVDALLVSRGMLGMLNTVFLIICAMFFGASMRASGMIESVSRMIRPFVHTRAGLVGSTVVTGTALNGIVSDQYLAVILTSNIFRDSYEKEGYEGRLLSRSVEDSATVTSPLYPWSSCGMTQSTILSVSTLAYAPFCFFNIISPLMSFLVALIGWKIVRKTIPDNKSFSK